MANTLFDTAVGSAPVVGDAFDALFRSNMKNRHCSDGTWKGAGSLAPRGPSSVAKPCAPAEVEGSPGSALAQPCLNPGSTLAEGSPSAPGRKLGKDRDRTYRHYHCA
jgi:hypothetical protein